MTNRDALEVLNAIASMVPTVHSVIVGKPKRKTINFQVKYKGWGVDSKGTWTEEKFMPFLRMYGGLTGYSITDSNTGKLTGWFGFEIEKLMDKASLVILSLSGEQSHWDFQGKETEPPIVASIDNPFANVEEQINRYHTVFSLAFARLFEEVSWTTDPLMVSRYIDALIGQGEKT
jgi:hypothetical protein